ncbi:MAG: hypothetical protein NT052_00605, partial [Candidatus Shapirobacteria bacterium]|nr:hypothetical protein [Candidatus Shapirobacteria bacterium]
KSSGSNSGQSLLIILLVTAVILTIGLAVASYSITDIKISQQEEESARAFSAAETGIEESLKLGLAKNVTVGEIVAKVSETAQGNSQDFDFGGSKFPSGELANVWLVGHNTNGGIDAETHFPFNGQIKICWGNNINIDSSTPAIELALVYKDSEGDYKIIRQGYDSNSGRTIGFIPPDDTDGENCPPAGGLAFAKDINLASGNFNLTASDTPYLLRLKLLYNTEEQAVAVNSSNNLPIQGKCYESSAEVKTSGITRKIRQCQFFEAPPEIFDYVLFTTGDLTK